MKENKLQPVEVEWIDAQSSMDAMTITELKKGKPAITKSCGYLIENDKDKIVLAFMMFGWDYQGNEPVLKHYQVIPKAMVKKIRKLKTSYKEKK